MIETKLTPLQLAKSLVAACRELGWTISRVNNDVVTITKSFQPGNLDEFVQCDMEHGGLLDLVPLRGGSIWGTDGGGIGGMVALRHGRFVMNKSGTGKRFAACLKKLVTTSQTGA